MTFQRLTSSSLLLAVLPLLAACTQTAAPPQSPGLVGSGALAAINDMQATQARHRLTSTIANRAAGFDPTGLSGHALNHMDNEQSRIEQEKAQKVDEEVERAVTEAEALQALSADLERQKASAGVPLRRKAAP